MLRSLSASILDGEQCESLWTIAVRYNVRKKWSQYRGMLRSLSRPAGHVRLYGQLQSLAYALIDG
jgi:hypothetical protein